MKLVDILARELKVWPGDASYCVQDEDREVRFHGNVAGDFFASVLADKDDEVYLSDGIPYAGKVTKAQWQAAVDALNAPKIYEWSGEGLPPIGTVCECADIAGNLWVEAKIHAHVDTRAIGAERDGTLHWFCHFRPIRTPEQIAAELEAAAIKDIALATGLRAGAGQLEVARAIYAAGYRKFEIIDEPKS